MTTLGTEPYHRYRGPGHVHITREGYRVRRVTIDDMDITRLVRRIEVIDDAGDAPRVRLELFALGIVEQVEPDEGHGPLPGQEMAWPDLPEPT